MKPDPRQAIRQFAVALHDPKAPNAISADGMLPLIRYLLANAPWSELVDVSGAVSLIFSAATRAEAVRKEKIDTSNVAAPLEWADIVTDEILRHPRTYLTLIKLPGLSIAGELNLTIGKRARIIRSDLGGPPSMFDSSSGLLGMLTQPGGLKGPNAKENPVCLEISASGYLDRSESSSAASHAISRAKQVLQIFNLAGSGLILDFYSASTQDSEMLGYEPDRPTNILKISLSEQLRQRLGTCRYVEPPTLGGGLFGLGSEQPVSQVESIANSLRPYTALLSTGEENQDAMRILTGLEWAFDADVERNETQALLNACIGIEAILGKSQETGLTDKLADRCAFMLGRGARQREQIASDFKKIYDARSKVVHGRRRRLQPHERGMLDQAKRLLRDILRREAAEFTG
ncbi:hypothetical protein C0Z18_32375 [Trinickia dabaoshanensis]|uniref:Uncharacterized protein n=1 Tax=Trinickia dabaoshanensis TaxID=564714 RepID=A0A2N7VB04_9BURK|nr:HEPN domain-containing protein [Trinickia dabaoshanensis]PMS13646.1 hypothetical protein C0Z18_32375 [Trinickia dabaoshanensis]